MSLTPLSTYEFRQIALLCDKSRQHKALVKDIGTDPINADFAHTLFEVIVIFLLSACALAA